MKLFVVGISHKTAPVEVREKLSFGSREVVDVNRFLKERADLDEVLILSTCNRVEIYAVADVRGEEYIERIISLLSEFHDINPLDFKDRLYVCNNDQAINHLFRVASGLDSMIIGEVEILGQVKRAYQDAKESGTIAKVLNRLFERAFNTAKKIRSSTFIDRGVVSTSSVAVRLANKTLGDLESKKVLIIGVGKIGEQLISYFKKNGIRFTLVANRTFAKANMLANRFGAIAVRFDNLKESLTEVDIVIASTRAPHCIIHKQQILELMPKRKQRPLFIIDLAVPRDVEAGVGSINNVHLYNIDGLQEIADKNIVLRQNELGDCQRIIDSSRQYFINWLNSEDKLCKIGV